MYLINKYNILYVDGENFYASKGYNVYRSLDSGENWKFDGKINDFKNAVFANSNRLLARLTRAEITNLIILKDGSRLVTAKKGIFLAQKYEKNYLKVFNIERGSRVLNVCDDGKGNLYFGEYFQNIERNEINIYKSVDFGNSWVIAYTFPAGVIRHVHGIFYDKFEDLIWFTTGDIGGECIIGYTNNGFKSIKIFKQGEQKYRAVKLLFFKDFIIYGTDTEYEQNYIYKLYRKTGIEERLLAIDGTVLQAIGNGSCAALATTVEPSDVNKSLYSNLLFTSDGTNWQKLLTDKKDVLPKYFQYGSFKFPIGGIDCTRVICRGYALKKYDNVSLIYTIPDVKNDKKDELDE